jgi:hypothetical protein
MWQRHELSNMISIQGSCAAAARIDPDRRDAW